MNLFSLFNNSNAKYKNTLILGNDAFLNEYLANSYIKNLEVDGLEKVVIDCEVDGIDELIATLTEASLFGSKKLVLVKRPFFITAKYPIKLKKKIQQLQLVFDNVNQLDDTVILVANYEKIDKRKKIVKSIQKNFNIIDTSFKPYEVEKIVNAVINDDGYNISRQALQLLLQRSDHVLDIALTNYDKLKISSDGEISVQNVEENIDLSFAQNVFAIFESAVNGDYKQAVCRLQDHLVEGTNPIQLIAVFESQIELLLCVKVLSNRKRSESQIVKELGIHPYRVKLALRSKIGLKKLETLLTSLIELDYGYKSGKYHDDYMLKMFILSC